MVQGPVAVSAPGKVLVAGGYLVLDRAYTGLVFGLDARIHVLIDEIPTTNGVALSEIVVRSPQFEGAVWEYGYRLTERGGGLHVTPLRVDADRLLNRNPFVETTLCYALSYIVSLLPGPVIAPSTVTILADNDYYTTPASTSSSSSSSAAGSSRFHNFAVPLSQANKTGLGSSAALVTALTAALLTHYLPEHLFSIESVGGKRRLHNLAQAAHCAAQGKVGSGFDVASAVYGSCIYRRFSPNILSAQPEPGTPGFAPRLRQTVDEDGVQWDTEILKDEVKPPSGLRMVMCDVSCGSQTPGMVKKVLAWRAAKPDEAESIWRDLHAANLSLASELRRLAENTDAPVDYSPLKPVFDSIRKNIRLMGEKSDVPIEPPAQTQLIDACCSIEGVVGGTVPGAGGFDAIVLLIQDNAGVEAKLKDLFRHWNFDSDGVGKGRVSMLGVKEEMEGVRTEDVRTYQQILGHEKH